MILGGHAQNLHGDMLERQQKLGAVGEKQVHVMSGELHHHVGSLEIVAGSRAIQDFVVDLESSIAEGLQ